MGSSAGGPLPHEDGRRAATRSGRRRAMTTAAMPASRAMSDARITLPLSEPVAGIAPPPAGATVVGTMTTIVVAGIVVVGIVVVSTTVVVVSGTVVVVVVGGTTVMRMLLVLAASLTAES